MKKKFSNKIFIITSLSIILLFIFMIIKVYAYFYDSNSAYGSIPVLLESTEAISTVTFNNNESHIIIQNVSDVENYVRIKIFSPVSVTLLGDNWVYNNEDGYYYFQSVIKEGENANEINLNLDSSTAINNKFNIIIVTETTNVLYDDKDSPYADWEFSIYNS